MTLSTIVIKNYNLFCYIVHNVWLLFLVLSTMSTRGQYEKYISTWIQWISTESIQDLGFLPFLTWHHPPTLEASNLPTKKYFPSKHCTQFDSFPLDLLHNIYMWRSGFLHHNKLKPVLGWIKQHNTVICSYTSYALKYVPFDYYMHYYVIWYVWADRRLGPHTSDCDHK